MGDKFGNVFHYGERDCSVQRRHQKLIEESPSPALDEELRSKMGEAAVLGAKSVDYLGAGTIEFLLDKHKNFYFMEMNTRIQVEHPVTETVYSVDLVRQQILVAAGQKADTPPQLPFGHSIEFRINAEDPEHGFRPSPGKITSLNFPGGFGIRVDSHIYQSYTIPPYYDSLIAKLIIWGRTRERALARSKRALEEFVVEGIKTTIPFHLKVLQDPRFISGHFDTGFLEKFNDHN
jgi:acetyl-CoA carboxylase biotin carboxylase subunit